MTNRWLLTTTFLAGMLTTYALAAQPKMEAAMVLLRDARAALREATADKGGHRQKALDLIEEAMKQVQAGIEYGRKH
jgi:hypothetical protein